MARNPAFRITLLPTLLAAIDAKVERGAYRSRTDFLENAVREKLARDGYA